jgi:RNA polymerase sigma-70 factor, ECF subfamily
MTEIPTLHTTHLTLRPILPADVTALYRIYQAEGVLQYFPNPAPPPLEKVERFVAYQQTHWEKYGYGNWAILPEGEREIAGWAGLQYLPELDETEVGFLLDRPFWGKGYATQAARAALRFGFEHFDFDHIIALVHPENAASRRVIAKCGMNYVDTLSLWGIALMRYQIENWVHSKLDFHNIYDAYQPRILRHLVNLVGELEADDLTQEVFVKVSQALKNFRGESQLSTWIYRIATNTAIDRMRTASFRQDTRHRMLEDADEAEDKDVWTGEEIPSLEQQLMRKEMYACFIDFVQNLPQNYQTVVVLSELGDLTNKEIAEVLGLSLDVVKIRLHRGRTRLLQELRTHCKAEDWL